MRVGVAGARGFIGRHLALALGASGHDVVAFGREGLPPGAAMDALLWAGGDRSGTPSDLDDMHVASPVRALEALATPPARVVYLSSGEVYGCQPVPFGEDAPTLGRSPYARAKLAGERRLSEACRAAGTALVILRAAVIYGPGQTGALFIPSLVRALDANEAFDMTPGVQTRDFLHVADLVRLALSCLAPDIPSGLYNASTGHETRVIDLARRLAWLAGLGRERLLRPGALPYREGEQMRYALDPSRARERMGFTAAITLDAGLSTLLDASASRIHRDID